MSRKRNKKGQPEEQVPHNESKAPAKRPQQQRPNKRDNSNNKSQDNTPKHEHAPTYVYLIKNQKTSETYICGGEVAIDPGTFVVAPTRYGLDMAMNLGYIRSKMLSTTVKELLEIAEAEDFVEESSGCESCKDCPENTSELPTETVDDLPQESTDESPETESPEEAANDVAAENTEDGESDIEIEHPEELENDIEEERKQLFEKALEQEKADRDKSYKGLERIERVADDYDLMHYKENLEKSLKAMSVCKEKIKTHKLDMKLVDAHYLLCESKVLFFFTAENRVDFRELVKDLVSVFRMRIELRQIGVRDESRVLGGLGVCGRDYCCHGVTDHLRPVSIKMAKEQNLSLNSMKISGPCGRLLCCLAYEYDFYKEVKSKLPSVGNRLKIRNELLKISEVNILSKKYHLTASDGRMLTIPFEKVVFNKDTSRWDVDKKYIEEVLSV